jgi:predicted kinase
MQLHDVIHTIFTSPTLVVPIGPSGAGKSTLFKGLSETNPGMVSFSLDTLRHQWYDANDYSNAFRLSCADKKFEARAKAVFEEMIKQPQTIFVDNTNLTPKRRAFHLEQAHKYGYTTVAIILNTPLEVLIERQTTRGDKNVPEDAVRRQYSSMVLPGKGEFDRVIMVHETKSNSR